MQRLRVLVNRNNTSFYSWVTTVNNDAAAFRSHSSLSSMSVWTGLHEAVRQGNGNRAEKIINRTLQDYYRFRLSSSSAAAAAAAVADLIPAKMDNNNSNRHSNGNTYDNNACSFVPPLDSRIFSLVLQAWKNSQSVPPDSALRAHKLLIQMATLADQDVLCDKPSLDDYLAVLECWKYSSSFIGNNARQDSQHVRNEKMIIQYSEELWNQMKERKFILDENAYEIFINLLAKAGRVSQAEEVFADAIAQQQRRKIVGSSSLSSTAASNVKKYQQPPVSLKLCHSILKAYCRSNDTRGSSERAEVFLQRMRTDSSLPHPDVESYNLVIESIINSHRQRQRQRQQQNDDVSIANKIEELIQQMKEDEVQPNLTSYEFGIDCLTRAGKPIRGETLLANLVRDYFIQYDADLKPNITPFQSILFAYSKARRVPDAAERAESILNNMKELATYLDTYPTVWSYNIVMKCWSQSRSQNAVCRTMALYDELRRSPNKNNNEGIRSTTDDQSSDNSAINYTLKPDATSMNTVLNVLSLNESAARTEETLWKFFMRHTQEPELNPCPDTIAFTTVIKAWSNSSDPDSPNRAERLLHKMLELYDGGHSKHFKPDIITYTSVMQCWVKSKKREAPEKAEALLRHLQDINVSPDVAAWNSAISAWASARNGERAEALFTEMVMSPNILPSPNPITLTNVLNAWSKTRSREAPDRVLSLLAKMEQFYSEGKLAIKPNVVHYSVAIDCLAYAKSTLAAERAENMLRKMAASKDQNMIPTVVSYNSVIKAWCFARDPRSITRITCLLREIIEQSEYNPKMRPNSSTFGQVLVFLNNNNVPDKINRAKAIKSLMDTFLHGNPKNWVQRELKLCLATKEASVVVI